jgi:hypothetical protein
MKKLMVVLCFTVGMNFSSAQPPCGAPPCGGPGNGNGNPCAGVNPPASCNNPVPITGVEILICVGIAIGFRKLWKNKE